jgi:hypothetical protein
MLEEILDSRVWLASWVAGVTLLNYSVGLLVLQAYSRQGFVERDHWRPPGLGGRFGSDVRQLTVSSAFVLLIAVVAMLGDRFVREALVGGMLVVQIATLVSNVADLLTYRALTAPDAAEGHVRYSAGYRYRAAAARCVGLGLFTTTVALLFDSLSFLVGSAQLLATAGGWYRRARQAARARRASVEG